MKILNWVGGAFLLAVLGIATILGFQSPTGQPIWTNLRDAVTAVLGYAQAHVPNLADGHASRAVAIGAVGVIVVLALLKKPISVRAFTGLVLAAGVVALILYHPAFAQGL